MNSSVKPVIGLSDSMKLRMITPDEICSIHTELRRKNTTCTRNLGQTHEKIKLGQLPVTYMMKVDPNVQPVTHPPRRLPIAMEQKLINKLDDMVKVNVIAPVSTPTQWVS